MFGLPHSSSSFNGAQGFNTPEDGPQFTFEALTGMRAWMVADDGRLHSPLYREHVWAPGTNEATHPRRLSGATRQCEPCPSRDCGAGFYAYHAEDYWFANDSGLGYHASKPWMSGLIAGWGRVVNGPKGFRCRKACILALCLPIHQPSAWESLEGVVEWGSWEAWSDFAAEQVQRNFPAVPVFDSAEAMLAHIPLQGAA
jgi:hypothetical protein